MRLERREISGKGAPWAPGVQRGVRECARASLRVGLARGAGIARACELTGAASSARACWRVAGNAWRARRTTASLLVEAASWMGGGADGSRLLLCLSGDWQKEASLNSRFGGLGILCRHNAFAGRQVVCLRANRCPLRAQLERRAYGSQRERRVRVACSLRERRPSAHRLSFWVEPSGRLAAARLRCCGFWLGA